MTILELEILKKYNQFIFDRGEDWVSEIIERTCEQNYVQHNTFNLIKQLSLIKKDK